MHEVAVLFTVLYVVQWYYTWYSGTVRGTAVLYVVQISWDDCLQPYRRTLLSYRSLARLRYDYRMEQ